MNRTALPIGGAAIVIGAAIFAVRDRAPSQPSAPVQAVPSASAPASPDANELAALPCPMEQLASNVGQPEALPEPKAVPTLDDIQAQAIRIERTLDKALAKRAATEAAEPECFVPWASNPTPPGVTAWKLQTNLETQTIATSAGVESQAVLRARCTSDGSTFVSVTALPSGAKEVVFRKPITAGGGR